jgi:hypothetical protein
MTTNTSSFCFPFLVLLILGGGECSVEASLARLEAVVDDSA